MLTVLDDESGSIPIYDFSKIEMDFLISLLRDESKVQKPKRKEKIIDLLGRLNPDCELGWDDVFLIIAVMMIKVAETEDPLKHEQIDTLLTAFESVTVGILESRGDSVKIYDY